MRFFCDNIKVGDGCDIGTRNRFSGNVLIGNNVLFGPNNYISSATHVYEDVNKPILSQGVTLLNKNNDGVLEIGDGTWIGTNVAILGDVKIGKNCVIGANSVINKNIPDYSVVVGNPGKIVKRYNPNTKCREKIK